MVILTTEVKTMNEVYIVLEFNTPVSVPTVAGLKVINLKEAILNLIKGEQVCEDATTIVTMEVKRLFTLLANNLPYLLAVLNLSESDIISDWTKAVIGKPEYKWAVKAQYAGFLLSSKVAMLDSEDDNLTIEVNCSGNRSYWTVEELNLMGSDEPVARNFRDISSAYKLMNVK